MAAVPSPCLARPDPRPERRPAPAANPHWSARRLRKCHERRDQIYLPIAPETVTALCISCHDGYGLAKKSTPSWLNGRPHRTKPRWPTVNGDLDCQTCHDARRQCDPALERPHHQSLVPASDDGCQRPRRQQPPSRLRPRQCPPRDRSDDGSPDAQSVLRQLPRPAQTPKFSPHLMLAGDQQTVIEQRCQVCHPKPMDREGGAPHGRCVAASRSGDALPRAAIRITGISHPTDTWERSSSRRCSSTCGPAS